MKFTTEQLRQMAISHTLFFPTTLAQAITTLGFVQADPIRSPARAQDLILRLRVKNYKVNELENTYPTLEIEEDFLYAYGFVTRELQSLLHPRIVIPLSTLEKQILAIANESKSPLNSRELEKIFGKERAVNAWGGYSQAIKLALDNLHFAGLLRISGREKGRRIYIANKVNIQQLTTDERVEQLVLSIVKILYPVHERTLQEALTYIRRHIGNTKPIIDKLVISGILERHSIDNRTYLWPFDAMKKLRDIDRTEVAFLSPFDPLVWDRRRFEHLWGWPYRFEAYTPESKRVRGYYAMPLLWQDQIIGWTNIKVIKRNMISEYGYVDSPLTDSKYKKEIRNEEERMEHFLNLTKTA